MSLSFERFGGTWYCSWYSEQLQLTVDPRTAATHGRDFSCRVPAGALSLRNATVRRSRVLAGAKPGEWSNGESG